MKEFYAYFRELTKHFLLSVICLVVAYDANAQDYSANLSGGNESPPNASAGTGLAVVTIVGNTMRIQASFSGLSGMTTAAHIHAETAVAGTGTAGVATTTPSFVGFPAGVTSGAMDQTYDMTLASSYNASYITGHGGTTASAFEALKAALNEGKAYFNIHSGDYPGGEIRGFPLICNTIITLNQPTIPASNYQASNSITASGMIGSGSSVVFKAGSQIELLPEFSVENGSDFLAFIANCSDPAAKP
ncbi:MAG: CHRD domain-containing protein [Saprospiraceae bacterium]|nr:CHRD domain-containing protein [Saprospiraceae bacterium]